MTGDLTPYSPRDVTPYSAPIPLVGQDLARYQEDERGRDLRSVWGFLRRNWWILVGFLFLGAGMAFMYNRLARPVYQSAATIELESETTAMPTAFQMFPPTNYIATDMLVLGSRTLVEGVVDTLDLQVQLTEPRGVERDEIFTNIEVARTARPATYTLVSSEGGAFEVQKGDGERIQQVRPGQPFALGGASLTLSPEAAQHSRIVFSVRDFTTTVSRVQNRVRIQVPGRDARAEVLEIVYTDTDPDLAALVPNALTEQFIEHRRSQQKRAAISTVEFLRDQLDTLNAQLRDAELGLRKYRETAQVIDLTSEGATRIAQYSALRTEQDRIIMERNAIVDVVSEAETRDSLDMLEPSPFRRLVAFPSMSGFLATSISTVTTLEAKRNALLERRTADDPDVVVLTEQIRDSEKEVERLVETYLRTLQSQLAELAPVADRSFSEMAAIPRKEFEMAEMLRTTANLVTTAGTLQLSLKEAEITKAVDDPNTNIIDRALPPRNPIRPRRLWNLVVGIMLGLAAGVGVAYSRELLDNRIHTREDLRELTGVPVLGLIPRMADMPASLPLSASRLVKAGSRKGAALADNGRELAPRLIAESDRSSAVSEAFRSLRTNITFSSTPERASKVFVLTSPTPRDGKTTTAANLAVTFAQQGLRVVLIDADMRRGVLHKLFRLPRTPGLSNILVENVELDRAIRRVQLEQSAELDILPTGTVPPNPAELISAPRMQWLIERLEERYDAVLFDTPPLTLVTDAAILSSRAHTVLLVARANKTEQGAIHFAMEQLRNVGAPVRGTILNDVDYRRDGYGGKYNYNAYSYAYEPVSEG